MKILLHIGADAAGARAFQAGLAAKRAQLAKRRVLYPRSPGNTAHAQLYMAASAPEHLDPLRMNRGAMLPAEQARLRDRMMAGLRREVAQARPDLLVLSCGQLLGGLLSVAEIGGLRDMLRPLSDDITVLAHLGPQPLMMARAHTVQLLEGRTTSLAREAAIGPDWLSECLDALPEADPFRGLFPAVQAPLFWLDYAAALARWQQVFGPLRLRPYMPDRLHSQAVTTEILEALQLEGQIGRGPVTPPPPELSGATLARLRQMNVLMARYLSHSGQVLPRRLRMRILGELAIDGPPPDRAGIEGLCARFAAGNAALLADHPELAWAGLATSGTASRLWHEADPGFGFRPAPYLLAFRWHIDTGCPPALAERARAFLAGEDGLPQPEVPLPAPDLSDAAQRLLPAPARARLPHLLNGPFAPHDRIGPQDEEADRPPFAAAPPRQPPPGSTGRVALACMKNEAPYIVEWLAYHRAVGFDHFLIFSNDCSDGTDDILDRLQAMGQVTHLRNDDWQGNSPQQWALDRALDHPLIRQAEWIAHFDVDEFVNIRCGNGTLDDLLARLPGATNIAMTWRLFGHSGVTALSETPVIAQFDRCAPRYLPKPHTCWGFKTLFRNIGAYEKLSCHRPNKLIPDRAGAVHWVNGSGQPMGTALRDAGWRNGRGNIGYDLVQLNHYALRSAESFLIKRQRGRALHVDRSIGRDYWLRMDWNDCRDLTIRRNLPRLQAEMARLLSDPRLAALHHAGRDWHRSRAHDLRHTPGFDALYDSVLQIRLTAAERTAWALSLDDPDDSPG